MTAPTPAAPAAPTPATDPAAPPAEPLAPAAATPTPAAPTEPPKANPWDDPKAAQAEIEKLRKENGAARTNAKAQAADEARNELAQSIGKALGLVKDEPVDPAALTAQLTTEQAKAHQATVELAVFRAAADAKGDPSALLDSRAFLAKIADIDPADTAAIASAITAAVAENPRLGMEPGVRLPIPNPALGSSGGGAPDLESQIAVAQKAGDFKTVIALQNHKLTAPQR